MNWKLIEQESPAAWEAFMKWHYCQKWGMSKILLHSNKDLTRFFMGISGDKDSFNIRQLYDFLDSQGIYVNVTIHKENMFRMFGAEIHTIDKDFNTQRFTYRQEAESTAFTEAFKLLEDKLTKK